MPDTSRSRRWFLIQTRVLPKLAAGLGAVSVAIAILVLAVRFVPGAGPALADGLRAIFGTSAVTWLEERAANIEDSWKRASRAGRSRSIEEVSPAASGEALPAPTLAPAEREPASPRPPDVGPMNPRVAATEDGIWIPVRDPGKPAEDPVLFKTMLHPDPKRRWSEAFVIAVARSRVGLYAVAGTVEPEATTPEGRGYRRRGVVPKEHFADLLFAFNGGFKTEHGRHGMFVDGVTLVAPLPNLCTVAAFDDDCLVIGTWRNVQAAFQAPANRVRFWRQAAPCMYENGALNALLASEDVRDWGATLDGNVVIRRSAIGLDDTFFYVAISNDTTARAIAEAMRHAGAHDVAQLDVNWSYPKILVFPRDGSGVPHAAPLFTGFLARRDEYTGQRSERDFFYALRRH